MAHFEDWNSVLNSCLQDPGICAFSMSCCIVRQAMNKSGLDGRECTVCDALFSIPCQPYFDRQQIRAKYGFQQDSCADCLAACLCPLCSVCQNAREIKYRQKHIVDISELANPEANRSLRTTDRPESAGSMSSLGTIRS